MDSKQNRYCQKETVYIKNGTRDILSPIEFRVNYTLANNEIDSAILNRTSVQDFRATFQKDCGDDDTCTSYLNLTTEMFLPKIKGNEYSLDLGRVEEITLIVNISNKGEAAYDAQLFVSHPSSISYIALSDKSVSNINALTTF